MLASDRAVSARSTGSQTQGVESDRMISDANTVAASPSNSLVSSSLVSSSLVPSSLVPSSLPSELSDSELLVATRRLVGRSNQLLAALLAHLGEVEARGVHRSRACSSLYSYCIYELRFSEDEAFRRVSAARLVRRFPALLDVIAAGELHLTGLLMLGPHLTNENLGEVLTRAKHRTKKEIARLVRILDPLPAVPARIEPLGSAPAPLVPKTPTWTEFTQSFCPVRELSAGERPRDWVEPVSDCANDAESARLAASALTSEPEVPPASASHTARTRLEPARYGVHFTAGEEYVALVAEAQALLSHSAPGISLDELHLRAMRALVAQLKRKKYALPALARKREQPARGATAERANDNTSPEAARVAERDEHTRRRGQGQQSRHIPAAVRHAVHERDGARCTYSNESGRRCAETHRLELHHIEPFAHGGAHTPDNLTLHCRAHNALAAEQDFGHGFMQQQRRSENHERWGE